jgi:hypothetical protein
MKDAFTAGRAELPPAHVLPIESRSHELELSQDLAREIVPAIGAAPVGARQLEQRGSIVDYDASDMADLGDAAAVSLANRELERK